jgi:hypothetical protein
MKLLKLSHLLILIGLIWLNSRKQIKNHSTSQDRPTDEHNNDTQKEQTNVNPHQSFAAQPKTSDEHLRAEQSRNWRRQLWPQWVLAGTAVVASVIGIYTLNILNRTLKATESAVDAANIQANAAMENVNIFRVDQRAWVGVKQMIFRGQVKPGSELFAIIQVQNTGKTPALEVSINHTLTFSKPTKEHFAKLPKIGNFGKMAIAPDGIYVAVQMFSGKLSEIEIEKLNKDIPYVVGRISYKDVFGGDHQTWFCSFYRQDFFPALHFCETLNYMD